MRTFDLDSFIVLVLIDKIISFRNSYSLSKVLAWKFDIINLLEVGNKLRDEGLIDIKRNGALENFEITKKGSEFIDANLSKGKGLMLQKYQSEQDFINALFPI